MGSIDEHQHKHFLEICPTAESYIVDSGITLIKIWLEVGQEEQERRFNARINDPLRQWDFGQDVGAGRIVIRQKITQSDLAAMVGIAFENVSRILNDWKRRKLVSRLFGYYCIGGFG